MRSIFCFLMIFSLLNLFQPQLAWAEGSDNQSVTSTPVDLDLSSTERSLSAASVLTGGSQATINLGANSRTVSAADMLTAAELVAVGQVLNSGQQALLLNDMGAAIGGGLHLSSTMLSGINNLVIPVGVEAFHNAAISQNLSLIGNFTNSGSYLAFTSNPAVNAALLTAANIFNGGLISSTLSNFTLNAVNNIVNTGVITSTGNLTMNAGGSVVNSMSNIAGLTATMQAANNLTLTANNIVNSGLMSALSGNLNFHSSGDLAVNNSGGSIQALLGSINVRDALYTGSNNLSLVGGDWLSKELNLHSGSGSINAQLGQVTGSVSTSAAIVHFGADTDKLVLGSICVTGDPVYYNLGDIEITSSVIVGEDLAILATGNITSTAGVGEITARDGLGQGDQIYIVAGANILTPCSPCSPDASPGTESTVLVTIDGASATGGNIDFSASPGLQINSNSTASNFDGGNITLAAFAVNSDTGNISLASTSLINSSGDGLGNNGNVNVIAGGATGQAITLGAINANGGAGFAANTGYVTINSANPVSDNGQPIDFDTNGSILSGNTLIAGPVQSTGTVGTNGNISAANDIVITTTGYTNTNATITAAGNLSITSSGNLNLVNSGGTLSTLFGSVNLSASGTFFLTNSRDNVGNGGVISSANFFTASNTNGQFFVTQFGGSMTSIGNMTIENITPNGSLFSLFNYDHSTGFASVISSSGDLTITQQLGGGQMLVENIGGSILASGNLQIEAQGFDGLTLYVNNRTSDFNVGTIQSGLNLTITGAGQALTIDNLGGAIQALAGDLTISKTGGFGGPGMLINNTFVNGSTGSINAVAGAININSVNGPMTIMNVGGNLFTDNGNINVSNSGGKLFILNSGDCAFNGGIFGNNVTGNMTITNDADIVVVGYSNGFFGTVDAAGTVNLTSTAGSIILGQNFVEVGAGVNVDFAGNFLAYSNNGTDINPNILSGQLQQSIVDVSGVTVYYFGNQQQVLNANGTIVLSTGSFDPATINLGTLEVTNIVGSVVIAVRGDASVNDIASIVTNGGNAYIESTDAGGIVMSGDIDTRPAVIGDGGYAVLCAASSISTNNVATTGVTDGNGGSVSMIAAGGALNVIGSLDSSGVAFGRGGSVLLTTVSGSGLINFTSINATGGDTSFFGGGQVTIQSCGACTGTAFIDTSAVPTGVASSNLIDAGIVNISSIGDLNLVSVRAEGNRYMYGHYVSLSSSTGVISVVDFIDSSGGSADGLSAGTGSGGIVSVVAQGAVSVGGNIRSNGDTNGHGSSVTLRSDGGAAVNVTGAIDTSGVDTGNGASVVLDSFNFGADVSFGSLNTASGANAAFGGGSIDLFANNLVGGFIDTSGLGTNQDAGYINIRTNGDVTVGSLSSRGDAGRGSHFISVVSQVGNITTDFIDSSAVGSGSGGNVTLNAVSGSVLTQTIVTDGVTGNAGSIDLDAFTTMDVQLISASAGTTGNAGSVNLSGSAVTGVSINAVGGTTSGRGGDIVVGATAGNILFTNFLDSSARGAGRGGDVTLVASNDVTFRSVNAVGGQGTATIVGGGNVLIQATAGALIPTGALPRFIDSSGSIFSSGSAVANAGSINITTGTSVSDVGGGFSLRAEGSFAGGNGNSIIVTAGGSVDFDFVSSSASTTGVGATGSGSAGPISIVAPAGISVVDFRAQGGVLDGSGGPITATAAAGSIVVDLFVVSNATASGLGTVGSGGTIQLNASTGISIGTVLSPGFILSNSAAETGVAGSVDLITTTGDVFLGTFAAAYVGEIGNGGALNVTTTAGNITVGLVANFGGSIAGDAGATINFNTGNGNITFGSINSTAIVGSGSDVTITSTAGGDVTSTTGGISTVGGSFGMGGDVDITAGGGEISLVAGINSAGGSLNSAGDITLNADGDIEATFINAVGGTLGGNGGDVLVTSQNGDITFNSFVSSRSISSGTGGNVDLTADGTVRVLGVTGLGNAIQSHGAGVFNAGNITITYNDASPFTIDPAGGMVNGTAGPISAISTGTGVAGTVTINNTAGDIDIVLNSTIDVTSTGGGTAGLMNFAAGLSSTTITGNASGLISGPLLASGNDVTITLARPNTTLLVGAINAADLVSITVTAGASSINVPVGANIHGDGTGIVLNTPTITNDGSLRALTGLASLTNAGSLSLTGTGTLFGITINLNSTAGAVNATQNTITGPVSGTASTNFNVTANTSGLTANNITATTGAIGLTANGGLMSVIGNSTITAGTNVAITGNALAGVDIGGGVGTTVVVTAGFVGGALNPFSLNMNDYSYTQIASPGGVTVTSSVGSIALNTGVTLDGIGGSVGLLSADNLTFGTANDLFSQGAYVWMQASNNITAPAGTSITSVARTIAGTVVVDGVNIYNFTGGGVAIFAGSAQPDYNTYLKDSAVANRTATGSVNVIGAPDTTGTPLVLDVNLVNGAYMLLEVPAGGSLTLTNSAVAIDGGVIAIDPPGIINFNGLIFNAIGPALVPVPVASASAPAPAAAAAPVFDVALPAASPPLPPDGTAIQTDVSDFATPAERNATAVMQSQPQIEQVTQQSAAWVFVSGGCQPFSMQLDESLLFGCGGTMFKPEQQNNGIDMKEGRIVAITATKRFEIDTRYGKASIPPESAGIVEQKSNGVFRLVNLAGGDAEMTIQSGDQITRVPVKAGEELVVADNSVAEEDLIPVDGIDRVAVAGSIRVAGLQASKSTFDKKQMFEREALIHCSIGSDMWSNVKRRVDRVRNEMIGTESAKAISSRVTTFAPAQRRPLNSYVPISYRQEIATKPNDVISLTTDSATLKYMGSTKLNVDKGVVEMSSGSVLVSAAKTTVLKCGDHLVSVNSGSVAMVSNSGDIVKVCNLWEPNGGAIKTYSARKMVPLNVGKQLILGADSYAVTLAIKNDPVARRRSFFFELPDGKGAARSEVSLVSICQTEPLLKQLLKSTDELDQTLAEKIVKMAAVLAQTTANHGPYHTTVGAK